MKTGTQKLKILVHSIGALFLLTAMRGFAGQAPKSGSGAKPSAPHANASAAKPTSSAKSGPAAKSSLQRQLAEQQREISKLTAIVEQLRQQVKAEEQAQDNSQTAASALPTAGTDASLTPVLSRKVRPNSNPAIPLPIATPAASNPVSGANSGDVPDSPLQFHLGSAYFTPVGFMDITGVWRNHDVGSGIGTNFGGIPYGDTASTNLSEYRMSMQNSRVGFRVDALTHGAHIMGYMEADFLGIVPSPTNLAVSSNSNPLRSRLYWLDIRKGDWEFLGGQTWSLATPGRTGISPLPGDIFFSQDMDTNYQAGLVWGRIPELRFVVHPSKTLAFAIAADSPDQYAGGSAGGGLITPPSALTSMENELDGGGTTGWAANTNSPNVAPDLIAKLAFDPSHKFHIEVGGIERNFKLWNPSTATTYTATGGGGFVNLNFQLFKGMRILTNNYVSDGGGRYIFGQAPDLIIKADGSPSLIHASSTVTGLEYTHRNSLWYAYYGGINVGRNWGTDSSGKTFGYGYPGSASSQNRTIQEATFGLNQALWHNPSYGAVNFISQYSYLTRDPWSVATGSPANAKVNMVFFDIRYSLPGAPPALK